MKDITPLSSDDQTSIHARDGAGRILRSRFYGSSGQLESLGMAQRSGVVAGSPCTLSAGMERKAVADVLRAAWNTAGTTLTLRVYKRTGQTRTLLQEGTVDSGATTVKGISQPSPALPMHASPAFAGGDFELEVETNATLPYSGEFQE